MALNEQKVIEMYTKYNMGTSAIAKTFETYPNKINRILKKCGVAVRNRSESQKLFVKKYGHQRLGKKNIGE